MTNDILLTFGILLIAIVLFSTEKLRSDLVAILIMVLLAWSKIIPVSQAFSGFSSNAVVSIMGVMLLGYGIDRTGLMKRLSQGIAKYAGNSEKKILVLVSATVGLLSAFMQNIGAAALFLPVVRKISAKTGYHPSKFLMPMGFAAILGGTLTMVASGPLIVLNDLLTQHGVDRFGLFDVTPIGLALLLAGIGYFLAVGSKVLPKAPSASNKNHQEFLKERYSLPDTVWEAVVTSESTLLEKTLDESPLWSRYRLHLLALSENGSVDYAPWRKTRFRSQQVLAILGSEKDVRLFAEETGLIVKNSLDVFEPIKNEDTAGFAEIILPPHSSLHGKYLSEVAFRKNFNIEPIACVSRDGVRVSPFHHPLRSGHELIVFGRWQDLVKLKENRDLVVVTDIPRPDAAELEGKQKFALLALILSLSLIMLGVQLSLAFFTGSMLMILTGAIPKEEIYKAIDWKTVFLLAGLIPLAPPSIKAELQNGRPTCLWELFPDGAPSPYCSLSACWLPFSAFSCPTWPPPSCWYPWWSSWPIPSKWIQEAWHSW
ncbi:SLC13 family permease [Alkalibacter rhizosphaerae]|uniref:SLC13 family permease n=1 Tax=Alkalibacter rhizosphaerae TaxID=2815577 RepID=A0A974XDT6_9FIRM|nr:SLC13 family permease [Alkalibacter rhizosphaerae]